MDHFDHITGRASSRIGPLWPVAAATGVSAPVVGTAVTAVDIAQGICGLTRLGIWRLLNGDDAADTLLVQAVVDAVFARNRDRR